jgi:arsenate reductase
MLKKLGEPANTLLRKRDKAYKELSLTGKEDDATLIPLLIKYPTLMQRPIFIHHSKAVVGRPVEIMLTII